MTPGLLRYWHTYRHLRPRQVIGKARLVFTPSRLVTRPAPSCRAFSPGRYVTPAAQDARIVEDGRISVLGQTRSLDVHGWDDPAVDTLWRYHLHYFDYLNAEGADGMGGRPPAPAVTLDPGEPAGQGHGVGGVPDVTTHPQLDQVGAAREPALAGGSREPRQPGALVVPAPRDEPARQPPAGQRERARVGRDVLRGRGERAVAGARPRCP